MINVAASATRYSDSDSDRDSDQRPRSALAVFAAPVRGAECPHEVTCLGEDHDAWPVAIMINMEKFHSNQLFALIREGVVGWGVMGVSLS